MRLGGGPSLVRCLGGDVQAWPLHLDAQLEQHHGTLQLALTPIALDTSRLLAQASQLDRVDQVEHVGFVLLRGLQGRLIGQVASEPGVRHAKISCRSPVASPRLRQQEGCPLLLLRQQDQLLAPQFPVLAVPLLLLIALRHAHTPQSCCRPSRR